MSRRTFADLFRATVGPRLRDKCRVQGVFVGCQLATFGEAHAEVMHEAIRLGATHLPDTLFRQLDEQLATWILESASKVSEEREAIVTRLVQSCRLQ